MTKDDLVKEVVSRTGLTACRVREAVDVILKVSKKTLGEGEKITIRNFGEFSVRYKHKREGRNPRTGEPVDVSARKVVRFKAGHLLKQKVK